MQKHEVESATLLFGVVSRNRRNFRHPFRAITRQVA